MITTTSFSNHTRLRNLYMRTIKNNLGFMIFFAVVSFLFFPLQYLLSILSKDEYFYSYAEIYTPISTIFFTVRVSCLVSVSVYVSFDRLVNFFAPAPLFAATL